MEDSGKRLIEEEDGRGTPDGDPLSGTPYRFTKVLGEGGTSEVYEARPREGGRRVAVKVLPPRLLASHEAIERMRIEAETLLCIDHPNIVRVIDFGKTPDERPYLVEQRLYGRSLHREIRKRGPIPALEAVDLVCQLLSGLTVVHRLGIVHRDLKLGNLFLARHKKSAERTLKLLDFGFAKVLRIPGEEWRPRPMPASTAEDVFLGTPRYAAPEQVESGQAVGPAADLYTAGLVLYALLAGREPFAELDRETDVLLAQVERELGSPAEHAKEPVAVELEQLLRKAVAKDPKERFQSAFEMREALQALRHRLRAPIGWARTRVGVPQPQSGVPQIDTFPTGMAPGSPSGANASGSPAAPEQPASAAASPVAVAVAGPAATASVGAFPVRLEVATSASPRPESPPVPEPEPPVLAGSVPSAEPPLPASAIRSIAEQYHSARASDSTVELPAVPHSPRVETKSARARAPATRSSARHQVPTWLAAAFGVLLALCAVVWLLSRGVGVR